MKSTSTDSPDEINLNNIMTMQIGIPEDDYRLLVELADNDYTAEQLAAYIIRKYLTEKLVELTGNSKHGREVRP